MSFNSSNADLFTVDEDLWSSRDTNPFRQSIFDSRAGNISNETSNEGALALPNPFSGYNYSRNNLTYNLDSDDRNSFDIKLDKLIEKLSLVNPDKAEHSNRDIRHIDSFSGEGSEVVVVSKLKTFIRDFDDFFCDRNLTNRDKIALVRQKLTGSAKSLVNSAAPCTYLGLRKILIDTFGQLHMSQEELLVEMKNIKLREGETFRQFSIRALDLANVVAHKLECSLMDKIVFETFSKTLLSKFQPYVHVQAQIKSALLDRSPHILIRELCDLIELDSSVFMKVDKRSNKPQNKNVNYCEMNQQTNITCGHCFRTGHVVKDCSFLKGMGGNNNTDRNFHLGRRN